MEKSLGCLSFGGLVIGLLTLIIIGGLILLQGGAMFSPGKLNAQAAEAPLGGVLSHAELNHNCSACHTAPWQSATMSDQCLTCHTNISIELNDPQSLHGSLLAGQVTPCYACHTDHNGTDAMMTIMKTNNFPHEVVGFSLQGHAQSSDGSAFACEDCHQDGVSQFEIATCETCHLDIQAEFAQSHTTAFGRECLSCHDGIDTYGADFNHNQWPFPLEGEHAGVPCIDCHAEARTIEALQAAPQDCYTCHTDDDEHKGRFTNCEVCHTPVDWEQVAFDHNLTVFPLDGGHVDVACEDCHQNDAYADTSQDCYSCHAEDDAHNGEYGQNCADCHITANWEQVTFDHNLSDFPLEGGHVGVACEDCHQKEVYEGTPQDCYSCHAEDDAHEGEYGNDCAACHNTTDWAQATFDHELTDFPLTGAHISVACTDCHQNNVYAGTPQDCVGCHADPFYHQGLFSSACEDCHTTTAWFPAKYNQPHTFPLDHGESGVSACNVCHDTTLNRYTCYGCHEHNPANIAEEHRDEGISNFNNCLECHPTGREAEGENEGREGGEGGEGEHEEDDD